jgi:hypothetical protein
MTLPDNDHRDPPADFVKFYRLIENSVDWLTFTYYTNYAVTEGKEIQDNMIVMDDYINNLRGQEISKPILIPELGICGKDRGKMATGIINRILTHYSEVSAIALSSIGESEKGCMLGPETGYPEIKALVEGNPTMFHSCPFFSGGTFIESCEDVPQET